MADGMTIQGKNTITEQQASELDFVVAIDTSGSMGGVDATDPQKRTLFKVAEEFALGLARYAERVDDDGITVITFGGKINTTDGVTGDKVAEVFSNKENQPWGATPTAEAVKKIINMKLDGTLKKNVVAFIITDGEPNDRAAVAKVIADWTKHPQATEHGISFSFIQIGNDPGVTSFLQMLDDDLETKYGAKFDCVDTRTLRDASTMTPEQLIWAAQND